MDLLTCKDLGLHLIRRTFRLRSQAAPPVTAALKRTHHIIWILNYSATSHFMLQFLNTICSDAEVQYHLIQYKDLILYTYSLQKHLML